jgi:hypothetical protein
VTRHLWKIPLAASAAVLGLVAFTATAFAQGTAGVSPDSTALDAAKAIYNAFAGGHYAYAAALLVVAAMAVLKQYSGTGKLARFVHSDAGGALSTLVTAMALALASALVAPGAVLTFALLKTSFVVGVGAAGGYAVLKKVLIVPLIQPLYVWLAKSKWTQWAQKPFAVVLWFFDRKDFPSEQVTPVIPPAPPAPPSHEPSILTSAPTATTQEKP